MNHPVRHLHFTIYSALCSACAMWHFEWQRHTPRRECDDMHILTFSRDGRSEKCSFLLRIPPRRGLQVCFFRPPIESSAICRAPGLKKNNSSLDGVSHEKHLKESEVITTEDERLIQKKLHVFVQPTWKGFQNIS